MDCPTCHERVRAAYLICQQCGFRLPSPAQTTSLTQSFDRSQWAVLPPFPHAADRSGEIFVEAAGLLFFGFLELL